jgi:hypothetical protein
MDLEYIQQCARVCIFDLVAKVEGWEGIGLILRLVMILWRGLAIYLLKDVKHLKMVDFGLNLSNPWPRHQWLQFLKQKVASFKWLSMLQKTKLQCTTTYTYAIFHVNNNIVGLVVMLCASITNF